MQNIIKIDQGIARMPEWQLAAPVDFVANEGEHIAIVGPNGSGKTLLVDMLTGRHPLVKQGVTYDFAPSKKELVSDNIKYVTFRDSYGSENDSTYYLQQRWNQQEIDESTPTVGQLLEDAFVLSGGTLHDRGLQKHLYELFHLDHLLDKYIILLSSGELRKFQLTKVLLTNPRVLIMDNPFIGLDAIARDQLKGLLRTLSEEQALQIILVLSKSDDIPKFITSVVEVKERIVYPKVSRADYLAARSHFPNRVLSSEKAMEIRTLKSEAGEYHAQEVIKMNKVCIRYGRRTILNELDWTVRNGERWALSGQNGAGKSTLLSLVCADNPQGYACDIALFGHQRGSGESIWDIKRRIGYVSPEMHRAYRKDIPAVKIVASGLKDSVGLYTTPSEEDYAKCRFWMHVFGTDQLADRTFLKLSSGEQRLILLARAFVKDPELLVLDEPLHGLDNRNRQLVRDIIDTFAERENKTIIMVSHYQEELPQCIDHQLTLTKNE
ncbi:MAG: ATP-binding cassette domain-containing protein [Prevotella sp.]|nr:ATP-binding cassette domain-containing protein [Prevotella sp.]